MTYRIMEDVLNASEVKIHLETCSVYQSNPNDTATSKWHKASSIAEAENIAKETSKKYNKGWKKADCCMKFA
ncbi:hypothetical protein [Nitrosarchaeum sp. AC2]|uniref:hypothetical protein n=1 Tax=Nitrosarchaeum sp. AC2 TaxID=2259673 RepID=UPI0015C9370F|nr:hypothetical protein [Nitrosarchaeum sp. AC2]